MNEIKSLVHFDPGAAGGLTFDLTQRRKRTPKICRIIFLSQNLLKSNVRSVKMEVFIGRAIIPPHFYFDGFCLWFEHDTL